MKRWLAFALVVLPLAELGTFFYVAERIGYGVAIGALIATGIIGVALIRLQGFRALFELPQALLASGGFGFNRWLRRQLGYIAAGVLFFIPGFLTDLIAILIILVQLFVPAPPRSVRVPPFESRRPGDADAGDATPINQTAAPRPDPQRPPRGRILEGEYRSEKPPRA